MANTVTIRLGVGGRNEVSVSEEGMTVQAALRAANIKVPWSAKLFVNDEVAAASTIVKADDVITVSPRPSNG